MLGWGWSFSYGKGVASSQVVVVEANCLSNCQQIWPDYSFRLQEGTNKQIYRMASATATVFISPSSQIASSIMYFSSILKFASYECTMCWWSIRRTCQAEGTPASRIHIEKCLHLVLILAFGFDKRGYSEEHGMTPQNLAVRIVNAHFIGDFSLFFKINVAKILTSDLLNEVCLHNLWLFKNEG